MFTIDKRLIFVYTYRHSKELLNKTFGENKMSEQKERLVNASIKTNDKFYIIGTTDLKRREYEVKAVTNADYHIDGQKQTVTNVTALNLESQKTIVFNFQNLIGVEAKFIAK